VGPVNVSRCWPGDGQVGIQGGAGNDAFAFQTGGSLSSTLDGQGGVNRLDFSTCAGNSLVDTQWEERKGSGWISAGPLAMPSAYRSMNSGGKSNPTALPFYGRLAIAA
jgi:hypothetical protein